MSALDVAIVGEINLDLVLYGLPHELPLDRELLANRFEVTLGSSSAILAHNLAALGVSTGFITRLGPDSLGGIALDRLREIGVDLRHVVQATGGTGTGVTIILHHGSERRILTYPGTMAELTLHDLDLDYLASARHFHLSSLFLQKGLQADLPHLFRQLKSKGLTISLDTNDDPESQWNGVLPELLPLIDILLPNRDELLRMTHRDNLEDALAILAPIVPILAVKCGGEGAVVQVRGQRITVPPVSVQPVDTIGAGDSFNAGFLAAWLSGCNEQQSAAAGNITGALSTLGVGGTEAFRNAELRDTFLQKHHFPKSSNRSSV
ncbi:MAG TPA: carbohydrate kinase family protein [Edaphobacter sp.]|nr:carbohydrate kinase family protein [Edaphobacter sp.]